MVIPQHAPNHNTSLRIMSLEEEVKTHTRAVEAGEATQYFEVCPCCGLADDFRVYDCRPRTFRLIVDGCVKIFRSGIWRWRCLVCRERFTDYPPLPCRSSVL